MNRAIFAVVGVCALTFASLAPSSASACPGKDKQPGVLTACPDKAPPKPSVLTACPDKAPPKPSVLTACPDKAPPKPSVA
jgi:hypothetical protein